MKTYWLFAIILFLSSTCFASPTQVVIIRHGDKIERNGMASGPALDPTGYVRAIKFAFYYLHNFGEPDIIIAGNPNDKQEHVKSIREIQTIAPLANILQAQDGSVKYQIYDPYKTGQEKKLAKDLLSNPKFKGKKVLICWEHRHIGDLVATLGVQTPQPQWASDDFDSVYVLRFDNSGKLSTYRLLHGQYPVKPVPRWETLAQKFF